MKYLIDLTMLYEVDSGIIMINGEEESSIHLSNQGARLLYVLIINNGHVVEREDLIKKVWEDHGFTGSSVSLNVAVSEIRKAFRYLGCDPMLIRTIRGKGFCLEANIDHHTLRVSDSQKQVAEKTPRNKIFLMNTRWHFCSQFSRQHVWKLRVFFISIFIGITTFLLLIRKDDYPHLYSEGIHQHFLGKISECAVYFVGKNKVEPVNHYLDRIRNMIVDEHVNCQLPGADVYYSNFGQHQIEIVFLGVCYWNKEADDYKNCISYRNMTGT